MNDLILRAQKGDQVALSQMVEENVGLVWNVVKRFSHRGYELEDLFQIGSLGLIKAIKRFDVTLRAAVIHVCSFHDYWRNQTIFEGRWHGKGEPLFKGNC